MVDLQQHNERVGQANHASTSTGFGRTGVGTGLPALGTISGLPPARTSTPMLVLGA
jgi:hypothetical protein